MVENFYRVQWGWHRYVVWYILDLVEMVTVGRSGFQIRSFDLHSIGCGCLADDVVTFFCSCNMIPAALFKTVGPVTFAKVSLR